MKFLASGAEGVKKLLCENFYQNINLITADAYSEDLIKKLCKISII